MLKGICLFFSRASARLINEICDVDHLLFSDIPRQRPVCGEDG